MDYANGIMGKWMMYIRRGVLFKREHGLEMGREIHSNILVIAK